MWEGRGQGRTGLISRVEVGMTMMGVGLVRGVSMRLGGLLVVLEVGMGGIHLGIRGDGMACDFLLLLTFINH